MIKAILFDIDGVLIDSRRANKKYYRDLIQFAGYPDPPDEAFLDSFHRTAWDNIARMTGETDETKIRRVWEMLGQVPYPLAAVKIFPGAQKVLQKLAKTHTLALVTSRVKVGVEHFFQIFGNREIFSAVVAFEDYNHPKPDPEPILIALKRLKVKQGEAVYIGDSASDQEAARAAGVYFIGFNNQDLDNAISSFSQLTAAVKQLDGPKKI